MIKKVWSLVDVHYLLQNNKAKLLKYLSHKYIFINPDFDKIQTQSRTNIWYILIWSSQIVNNLPHQL